MPYISVESGALSDGQKEELIKRLTEVSSEIMKVPQEFFVTTIKEVREERADLCKWIKESWRKIGAEEYRRDNESYSFRI